MHHPHRHLSTIDSTHRWCIEHAHELADGTIITAEVQTEGCGRRGRTWISPPGDSLLASMMLKPAIAPQQATLATPILAIAVVDALAAQGLATQIRWPNDVVVAERKIAGILAQAILEGEQLTSLVISVGINGNQDEATLSAIDRPATSYRCETGRTIAPEGLLTALVDAFDPLWDLFLREGFEPIAGRWRSHQVLLGLHVDLDLGEKRCSGTVVAFPDDGSIEIEISPGERRRFHAGEIVRVA